MGHKTQKTKTKKIPFNKHLGITVLSGLLLGFVGVKLLVVVFIILFYVAYMGFNVSYVIVEKLPFSELALRWSLGELLLSCLVFATIIYYREWTQGVNKDEKERKLDWRDLFSRGIEYAWKSYFFAHGIIFSLFLATIIPSPSNLFGMYFYSFIVEYNDYYWIFYIIAFLGILFIYGIPLDAYSRLNDYILDKAGIPSKLSKLYIEDIKKLRDTIKWPANTLWALTMLFDYFAFVKPERGFFFATLTIIFTVLFITCFYIMGYIFPFSWEAYYYLNYFLTSDYPDFSYLRKGFESLCNYLSLHTKVGQMETFLARLKILWFYYPGLRSTILNKIKGITEHLASTDYSKTMLATEFSNLILFTNKFEYDKNKLLLFYSSRREQFFSWLRLKVNTLEQLVLKLMGLLLLYAVLYLLNLTDAFHSLSSVLI